MAVVFNPSIKPTIGSSQSTEPNRLLVEFGDGYEQRATYGPNPTRRLLKLNWSGISNNDADTLEDDLLTGLGTAAREYQLPWTTDVRKFVVEKVDRTATTQTTVDLAAELREVFDL